MQKLRIALLVVACVALVACAAQKSMKRGDRLMAAGNYEAAYNAYVDASKRRPGNSTFRAKVEEARRAVLQESLQLAEDAIANGEYERVRSLLDRADAFSDGSHTAELRGRARAAAEADARARLESDDYWGAYDLAFLSGRLFGINNELISEVRQTVADAGGRAMASGDYPAAWDLYRMIVDFEPNQAPNYSGKVNDARGQWVAKLRSSATKYDQQKKRGIAALVFAAGDALEGRTSARWNELATDLRNEHDLRFSWKTNGSKGLVGPTRTALAEILGVSARGPHMTLQANVSHRCSQSSETRTDSKDYLAGTRWVPNPKKQQLGTQLEQERALLNRDLERLERVKREFEQAQADAQPAIQAHNELVQRKRQLLSEREQVDRQLQQDRWYLEDTRRKYEDMKRQSDGQVSQGLMTWEKLVWEAEAKVQQGERDLAAIDDQIRKIEFEIDRINADGYEREVETRRNELASTLREAENQEARTLQVENAYNAEPAEIEEEIWETLRYPVEIVTRPCRVEGAVSARGVVDRRKNLVSIATTSDETHDAYPVAQVQADPLRLPRSDGDLIADASNGLGDKVRGMTAEWRRDAYARVLRPTSDANSDLERFVGICQAQPTLLTDESRGRAVQLARQYVLGFDALSTASEHSMKAICLQ